MPEDPVVAAREAVEGAITTLAGGDEEWRAGLAATLSLNLGEDAPVQFVKSAAEALAVIDDVPLADMQAAGLALQNARRFVHDKVLGTGYGIGQKIAIYGVLQELVEAIHALEVEGGGL